ncbi:MAG: FAD-dependent oxidoreductase [Anaeroplasmataceae bacterium]
MLGFEEVTKTMTKEEAIKEASRCLNCKKPMCRTGCPAGLPIPDFIQAIKNDDLDLAYELINTMTNLSPICSRVCAHEKQCIGNCIRNKMKTQDPINVGGLERYVGDNAKYRPAKPTKFRDDFKVAIIGAGPAGLSCALELAKNGIKSTVFERMPYAGGVTAYGIPEYRLPKTVLNNHIDYIKSMGVEFKFNTDMKDTTVEALKKEGYNKIFVSVGLTKSKAMRIPGEDAAGVIDANTLLKNVNNYVSYGIGEEVKLTGRTIVVGAGNVAMDACRTAVRIGDGSEVMIVYRRSLEEAPASKIELKEALEEGVKFNFLTNPVEVIKDETGHIKALKVEKMELGEPDESGRRSPIGTGIIEELECNNFIVAIGQSPAKDFIEVNNINSDHGYIVASDDKTSLEDVYAGGDIVRGADTVVRSMVDGKRVALDIVSKLN